MAATQTDQHDHQASSVERRQWGRFVSHVGKLVVRTADHDGTPAEVMDESFGGIGIVLQDGPLLDIGDEVEISCDGTPMSGVVRNIAAEEAGRQRIGVEWRSKDLDATDTSTDEALIEARLFMLFRMWETGNRDEIYSTVQTLRGEAETLGLSDLVAASDALGQALQVDRTKQDVHQALEALVDACTGGAT